MYRYEIKQVPGRSRQGIYVDGMLLAVIEDRRMLREAELLVKLADMENRYSQQILETMQRPMVFVVSEEEKARIEATFERPTGLLRQHLEGMTLTKGEVRQSEVRSDLNWDA